MIRLEVKEEIDQDGCTQRQDQELDHGANALEPVLAPRECFIAQRLDLRLKIFLLYFFFIRCNRHVIVFHGILRILQWSSPFFPFRASFSCRFFVSFSISARSAGVNRVPQVDFQKVNQATGICQSRTAS